MARNLIQQVISCAREIYLIVYVIKLNNAPSVLLEKMLLVNTSLVMR